MTNIEDIKNELKNLLDSIDNPDQIKQIASIDNRLDELNKEHEEFVGKYDDLKKAYKESVLHGGYTDKPVEDATGTKVVDFDIMLQEFNKNL